MNNDSIEIKGVYTAVVTPFTHDGKVDEEGFIANLHYQMENGADGLVVLGTTGEAPTLTHGEKKQLIQLAVREVHGRIPVMIGTGSYSTATAIENTLEAQRLGADAALVVTPYYNKPTQEGLYRHFKAIAEAVEFPIMVYNIAGRTGQNMTTETLKRLGAIRNIVGVKEASGSIVQMMEVMEAIGNVNPNFSLMCGDDMLTLPCMSIGGRGIISVVSNLVPRPIKNMVECIERKEYEEAKAIHYELVPLFRAAFLETNPIAIKAAMDMCGMAAGPCRLPLCELSSENNAKLIKVLVESIPSTMLTTSV